MPAIRKAISSSSVSAPGVLQPLNRSHFLKAVEGKVSIVTRRSLRLCTTIAEMPEERNRLRTNEHMDANMKKTPITLNKHVARAAYESAETIRMLFDILGGKCVLSKAITYLF